ncbi:MAG: hypothetical protein K0Q93_2458 [Nocardioidaceae bacterium]|nr:hypothetical protein [Nocardioidaceae bacterium]
MAPSAGSEAERRRRRPPRVAAFTMVCDEADMLPRWLAYYGDQLGVENLVVLDDNSSDGSTDGLRCTVHRLAKEAKRSWSASRRDLMNTLSADLLRRYDVVIFTDVDEFLIPDPGRYDGLVDYLASSSQHEVIAPLALNILHNPDVESPLEPDRPVLAQRRFVKFSPRMCKPLIKRVPVAWKGGGFHGIAAPFAIDRALLMAHLKYYDVDALRTVARRRHLQYQDGKGHRSSAWAFGPDDLISRLRTWVATPAAHEVPEFDPQEPDVDSVIVSDPTTGMYHTTGTQLTDMEMHPLRRLPDRFTPFL